MTVRVNWDGQLKLSADTGCLAIHGCADSTALTGLAQFGAGDPAPAACSRADTSGSKHPHCCPSVELGHVVLTIGFFAGEGNERID